MIWIGRAPDMEPYEYGYVFFSERAAARWLRYDASHKVMRIEDFGPAEEMIVTPQPDKIEYRRSND